MTTARVIKKYPNRRLYDTEESRYITLADVRDLVLSKTEFVVVDKKSGHDITRAILLQIIIEQEQQGDSIMTEAFLSQVIRAHGKVMPGSPQEDVLRRLTAGNRESREAGVGDSGPRDGCKKAG